VNVVELLVTACISDSMFHASTLWALQIVFTVCDYSTEGNTLDIYYSVRINHSEVE